MGAVPSFPRPVQPPTLARWPRPSRTDVGRHRPVPPALRTPAVYELIGAWRTPLEPEGVVNLDGPNASISERMARRSRPTLPDRSRPVGKPTIRVGLWQGNRQPSHRQAKRTERPNNRVDFRAVASERRLPPLEGCLRQRRWQRQDKAKRGGGPLVRLPGCCFTRPQSAPLGMVTPRLYL